MIKEHRAPTSIAYRSTVTMTAVYGTTLTKLQAPFGPCHYDLSVQNRHVVVLNPVDGMV